MRGFLGAGRWWYPALRRPPPHPFDRYHRSTSSPPIRRRGAQFFAKLVASPSTGLASLREDADKSTTRAADFIVTAPVNFGPRPAPRASDARYPSYPPPASAVLLPDPCSLATPRCPRSLATPRPSPPAGHRVLAESRRLRSGGIFRRPAAATGARAAVQTALAMVVPAAGCGDGPALVVRACL